MTRAGTADPKKYTASNLLGLKIVDTNGQCLGHVADIQFSLVPPYRVTALLYGRRGWLHRLHVLNRFTHKHSSPWKPDQVPWSAVAHIEKDCIYLKDFS